MKKTSIISLNRMVEKFNATNPIGTKVMRYRLINPLREGEETTTKSAAWVMGGHSAVIKVAGVSGAVILDSIVVL